MSDFEDLLRRALSERAAGLRTAPDEREVRARIRRAERSSVRKHRLVLVAALVIVAGSAGGLVGAVAGRPSGVQVVPADSPGGPGGGQSAGSFPPPGGTGHAHSSEGSTNAPRAAAPAPQRATLGGATVEWLVSPVAEPVEVVPGSGLPATCSKVDVVSLTVGNGTPVASGSGVIGLPALEPDGLAVVASGTFGSPGRSPGWWAILEAGSAASDVAVQFPSGKVVTQTVSAAGVAVLASLVPAGATLASYSQYASAVSDGPTKAMGSLEFLLGGGVTAVDALGAGGTAGGTGPASSAGAGVSAGGTGPAASMSSCSVAPALGSTLDGIGHATGPPAPLIAAGDVVAAYAQAYDVDPLLGLTWNFSAVDLGSSLGCPTETFGAGATSTDGLPAPAVQVDAVEFTSPTQAEVVYQRGAGALLETGTAELVGGLWKLGMASYCRDLGSRPAQAPAGAP